MKGRIFRKHSTKGQRPALIPSPSPRLLKYIINQQQIQQMSSSYEDNGLMLFFKLKHLFFEQTLEEDQIASIIRDNPLKVLDKILFTLTSFYSKKVDDMIQPLQEQKNSLQIQISQIKQKLNYSMEDNEYFKAIIDRLEEQKKDVEIKLNQSQSQIQRSNIECHIIAGQNIKIKSTVISTQQQNQNLLHQNSSLSQKIIISEKQIQRLRVQNKELNCKLYDAMGGHREIQIERTLIEEENRRIREQNQLLLQKVHRKQELIASFINQYNKIHFLQHHDSFDYSQSRVNTDQSGSNELKGFSFNQFDKQSIVSQHSSNNVSDSPKVKETTQFQVQDKIGRVCATAQKTKPPLPPSNKLCQSQEKCGNKNQFIQNKINRIQLYKQSSRKRSSIAQEEGKNGKLKTLTKTVSSKNFRQNEGNVTPSDEQSKVNLQETLRKKIQQRGIKIQKLETQLNTIRNHFIEQRERLTEMEGDYQIQIDELKEKNAYLKKEVNNLFQKYMLASSQNRVYQERVNELEQDLVKETQAHHFYCRELKSKCKDYIFQRIDQIQEHHYDIVSSFQNSARQQNHVRDHDSAEESSSFECSSEDRQSFSLHLHQYDDESPRMNNMEGSDIASYEKIPNHYVNVNGFTLDLDFSRTNRVSQAAEEIYAKDNFQIESDLGAFTERLVGQHMRSAKNKGHETDRPRVSMLKSLNSKSLQKNLTFDFQTVSVQIVPFISQFLSFTSLESVSVIPSNKVMSIERSVDLISLPKNKEYSWNRRIYEVKIEPLVRKNQIDSKSSEAAYFPPEKKNMAIIRATQYTFSMQELNNRQLASNIHIFSYFKISKKDQQIQCDKTHFKCLNLYTLVVNQMFTGEILAAKNKYGVTPLDDKVIQQNQFSTNTSLISPKFCQVLQLHSPIFQDKSCDEIPYLEPQQQKAESQKQTSPYKAEVHQNKQEKQVSGCITDRSVESCFDDSCSSSFSSYQDPQLDLQRQLHLDLNIDPEEKLSNLSINVKSISATIQKTKDKTYASGHTLYERNSEKQSPRNQNMTERHKKFHPDSAKIGKQLTYDHSSGKNSLNQAMIWSSSSRKQLTDRSDSSFGQRKITFKHKTESSEVIVAPWIQQQNSTIKQEPQFISPQLAQQFFPNTLNLFERFIKKYKLSIKLQEHITSQQYKLPKEKKRRMFVFKATQKDEERTFIMNNHRLFSLEDNKTIHMDKANYSINSHLVFGQSQLVISRDKELIINREGKIDALKGNIPDGRWNIESYLTYQYKIRS